MIFIRLLHLLAHHPDFGTTKEELLDAAMYVVFSIIFTPWKLTLLFISYIQFYLDLMATSENISLLYHLSFKGKNVRDSESHSGSEV
jgi:sister chromatid cohesion protein PDS5